MASRMQPLMCSPTKEVNGGVIALLRSYSSAKSSVRRIGLSCGATGLHVARPDVRRDVADQPNVLPPPFLTEWSIGDAGGSVSALYLLKGDMLLMVRPYITPFQG